MVTQAKPTRPTTSTAEHTNGSILSEAARIRNQWSANEKLDRRHQAYLFQQQLLRAVGLASSDGLEEVITVAQ
ncbi:hypothetical protein [Anatilimnocola floriformis]|uniref:hypothetical protein n=1 Tax=Anatilimnocola floriformis TaxID=2948575 RepID=UPI0020C389A4|nr:hypothetical protein [Anatilimnocola floriformis]